MKRLNIFFATVYILIVSCNNNNVKPDSSTDKQKQLSQKQFLQIDTGSFKLNPNDKTFYAICFEEHAGWCSTNFSNLGDAQAALDEHKKQTGHTDNTISNDCPFAGNINYDSLMIQTLKYKISQDSKKDLDKYLDKKVNPLFFDNIRFDTTNTLSKSNREFGGGANVPASGMVVLGGSTAGKNITVSVSGQASVRITMWFALAQIPAASWDVAGPGGSTFQLNCNIVKPSPLGCPEWFGQPVTIQAEAINGKFPVWVSFN